MSDQKCKICANSANHLDYSIETESQAVDCSYCGKYHLIASFETDIYTDKSNFYKLSSWIREQNDEFGITPKISREIFDDKLSMKNKRIKEKFDLMMIYLSKVKREDFRTNENLKIKSWIKDDKEFFIIYQKAIDYSLVKGSCQRSINADGGAYNFNELTFDGLEYVENLGSPTQSSKNIFVAFNFKDELKEVFNVHLNNAITENGFNYTVVNQDNVEHNKSINDEIIVKLKSSRIVIADFTNHRNSVYFEAGFAMGMGIPVIWTCQEGHDKEMSFDTRQFPHIIWKDKDDLVKQVIDRIKVIL